MEFFKGLLWTMGIVIGLPLGIWLSVHFWRFLSLVFGG